MLTRFTQSLAVCLVLSMLAAGCGKQEPAKDTSKAESEVKTDSAAKEAPESEAGAEAAAEVAVKAMLAKADLLDGTADQIVHRCANCALAMDGKQEHALESFGYTLYFCTAECQESFGKDLTESILALEIPGE